MQRVIAVVCVIGIALAVALTMWFSEMSMSVHDTGHHPVNCDSNRIVQALALGPKANAKTEMTVDVPSSNHVQELFSKTKLARTYYVPGECEIKPAEGISTIVFMTGVPSSSLKTDIRQKLTLGIDNATGDIVWFPGEKSIRLSESEIADIALSDFENVEYKEKFKALSKDIFVVPGMAIVTFGKADPGKARDGCTISPLFVYRVWIDTRTKTIFAGEIGN